MTVDVLNVAKTIIGTPEWKAMRAAEQAAVVKLLKVTVDARLSREKHEARKARVAQQVRRSIKPASDADDSDGVKSA